MSNKQVKLQHVADASVLYHHKSKESTDSYIQIVFGQPKAIFE